MKRTPLRARKPLSPGCGKRRYRDEIAAKMALASVRAQDKPGRPKAEKRAYFHPPCGGWHLTAAPGAGKRSGKARTALTVVEKPRKAPRNTGPTRKVRAIVLERDGYACVCCGWSVIGRRYALQHRDARGMGGTSDPRSSTPVNLLTMLEEHHLRVESRIDPEDNAKGYWLRMGQDPALEPVMYFGEHGSGFTAWLCEDGSLVFEAPAGGEVA